MSEKSFIVDADGNPAAVATVHLTQEEASLLRQYKKFLLKRGLKEALFCQECARMSDIGDAKRGQPHGCEAYVTDGQIIIKCRCTVRAYTGYNV